MSEYDIEELENSLELPIGAKFYFRNILFEVVEFEGEGVWGCPNCAFSYSRRNEGAMCEIMQCTGYRHDGNKPTYFKEVTKIEGGKNDEAE